MDLSDGLELREVRQADRGRAEEHDAKVPRRVRDCLCHPAHHRRPEGGGCRIAAGDGQQARLSREAAGVPGGRRQERRRRSVDRIGRRQGDRRLLRGAPGHQGMAVRYRLPRQPGHGMAVDSDRGRGQEEQGRSRRRHQLRRSEHRDVHGRRLPRQGHSEDILGRDQGDRIRQDAGGDRGRRHRSGQGLRLRGADRQGDLGAAVLPGGQGRPVRSRRPDG